ncbi:hypothetical protein D9756_000576 [Leucocoprinus leucothites]|uniref:Manganese/iron superoxide dismutase C-terminal domain-containing protein n=1 Tax=Leucocoprinus leucothites TaxID=201217 RepID=A0A8H5GG06_9AGAR|nr:hypothetical protein D9756_000576 [Leucoagaricus leucothites]
MNQLGLRLTSASARASTSSAPRFKSRWGTRRLHQQQTLPYPVDEGLGKFLPPEALKVQLEFQSGLLERLNEQVIGTTESGSTIAQTVINLSGKRDQVLAFNYASLALNNSFFLQNLKPPTSRYPNHEHEITDELHTVIRNAHGSIQQLRSAFSAAALGTFINGWVWLVADQGGNTGIYTTYGAGTLLVRSRSNMEKHPQFPESELYDTFPSTKHPSSGSPSRSPFAQNPPPGTSPSSPLSGMSGDNSPTAPRGTQARYMSNDLGSIHEAAAGLHSGSLSTKKSTKTVGMLRAGEILYPLFCVPVYEHAWMSAGYGVWGKEQWLKEFWSVLNWERVSTAYSAVWNAAQGRTRSRK